MSGARSSWYRILLGLASVGVAAASAAQAAANFVAEARPDVAIALSPLAANAYERLAISRLRAPDSQDSGTIVDARAAAPAARSAVAKSLLTTEAAAILALADRDAARRDQVLQAAGRLSRRGRVLQVGLIESQAKRADVSAALVTFDHLLRVYPALTQPVMPRLLAILEDPRSVKSFTTVLSEDPSWKNSFLSAAAQERTALDNLVALRLSLGNRVDIDNNTDRRIIESLVRDRLYAQASQVYHLAKPSAGNRGPALDWDTTMPPFDWRFTDKPGLYVRPALDREGVRFLVASGKGGTLAERLVTIPSSAGQVTIERSISQPDQGKNIRIALACVSGPGETHTDLVEERSIVSLAGLGGCALVELKITGRTWSGSADTGGTIRRISFS